VGASDPADGAHAELLKRSIIMPARGAICASLTDDDSAFSFGQKVKDVRRGLEPFQAPRSGPIGFCKVS
jgi:hypothetical protein